MYSAVFSLNPQAGMRKACIIEYSFILCWFTYAVGITIPSSADHCKLPATKNAPLRDIE